MPKIYPQLRAADYGSNCCSSYTSWLVVATGAAFTSHLYVCVHLFSLVSHQGVTFDLSCSTSFGESTAWCITSWLINYLCLLQGHALAIFPVVNSLAPGKFEWNFRHVIFKQILVIDGWGISCEIALRWISLNLTDDKSTLVQVMAWCHQATSHYLSQCWLRSLSPYGVTRPQWVKPKSWMLHIWFQQTVATPVAGE